MYILFSSLGINVKILHYPSQFIQTPVSLISALSAPLQVGNWEYDDLLFGPLLLFRVMSPTTHQAVLVNKCFHCTIWIIKIIHVNMGNLYYAHTFIWIFVSEGMGGGGDNTFLFLPQFFSVQKRLRAYM